VRSWLMSVCVCAVLRGARTTRAQPVTAHNPTHPCVPQGPGAHRQQQPAVCGRGRLQRTQLQQRHARPLTPAQQQQRAPPSSCSSGCGWCAWRQGWRRRRRACVGACAAACSCRRQRIGGGSAAAAAAAAAARS
jgi:hypothetical protein